MTPTGDADFVAVVIAIPRPAWGLLRHLPGAVRDAERWRMALGEVYRPRKPQPDSPAYFVMPALPLLPLATWLIERRRRRATTPAP